MARWARAGMLLGLCTCATAEDTAEQPGMTPLEGPRLLRRASLDIRGVLPSVDELDAVEQDPTALEPLLEAYLDDPLFADRYVKLLAERWHTRVDAFQIPYEDYFLDAEQDYVYNRSIGEEPLRLAAYVVANDLPVSELVVADYTVANDLLAEIWDLDIEAGEQDWRPARYQDGRPAAGVLATNGLWWRYVTNLSNKNRSRAAALSRLLLCQDYLARPISVTAEAAEGDEADAAVQTVPGCMSCHSSLDPMAAVLFGFTNAIQYNPPEMDTYHAEREVLGAEYLDVDPAYFGEPVDGLHALGVQIASDPRFVRCTAQSAAESLWRRDATPDDHDEITSLSTSLIEAELQLKPVLLEVLTSAEYQAGAVDPDHELAAVARPVRQVTSDQLATTLEDTFGFTWSFLGYDILDSDAVGLRMLAGGVDGDMITAPQQEPGLTWSLVLERAAQGAAEVAVVRELVEEGERTTFPAALTLSNRPGDPAFDDALAELCWRLYGERPTDEHLSALEALFKEVLAFDDDAATAWQAVLTAMIRDPDMVVY